MGVLTLDCRDYLVEIAKYIPPKISLNLISVENRSFGATPKNRATT